VQAQQQLEIWMTNAQPMANLPALPLLLLLVSTLFSKEAYSSVEHIRRSSEFLARGDLAAAEKEARLALKDPTTQPLGYAALGAIRLKQQRYPDSEKFLTKALRLNPQMVGARLNLGSLYLVQKKLDRAAEVFSDVLRRDSGNSAARFSLARIESEKGNYAACLDFAKPIASELRRSQDGLLLLLTAYLGIRDKESAKRLVADWKLLPKPDSSVSLSFALRLARNELVAQGIEILERTKNEGGSYELAFNLAGCYLMAGDLKRASDKYEEALAYEQDCVPCLQSISNIADREGNLEKALAYLIRAKRQEPANPDILLEFGKICLKKNLYQDAVQALEKAVALRPDHAPSTYVLASARVGTKRYEEARALLEKLLSKKPDDATLNYALGAVLYLELKLDEAATYLRKSVSLQPEQIASYYYLGLIAQSSQEDGEAVRLFQQVLRRNPNHPAAHEELGTLYVKQGKSAEAQQHLEKAVQLDPNSTKVHYQLGLLYARLGKKQESEQELELFKKLQTEEKEKPQELILLNPH
jgi:tetratricopeptide (TPR) repeat protein